MPALFDRLLRGRPGAGLLTVGAAAAAVALVIVVSLVRAHWGEAPGERSTELSVPPVVSSPGAPPDEPPALAEALAARPAPELDAALEAPGETRGASATAASPTKPDPAPPETAAASRTEAEPAPREATAASRTNPDPAPPEAIAASRTNRDPAPPEATAALRTKPDPAPPETATASRTEAEPAPREATAASRTNRDPAPPEAAAALLLASRQALEGQSRARPLASAASSNSPVGTPSRAQAPRPDSLQSPPESPQPQPSSTGALQSPPASPQAGPAASTAEAGDVSSIEERPMLPAGEIRVFIHHVANQHEDALLAQRVADHLRRQGFIVADIRPVDFLIGKPSVRYFFDHDRSASERLVDELGRFFEETASRAPDQASDFTHFEPKPPPGNVEVWLPAS